MQKQKKYEPKHMTLRYHKKHKSCLTTIVFHTSAMHKHKHDAWWSSTHKSISKELGPSQALSSSQLLSLILTLTHTLSPFGIKRQKPKKSVEEVKQWSPSARPRSELHRLNCRPSRQRRWSDPLKLHGLAKRSGSAL